MPDARTPDRRSPVPLWSQILDDLRARLAAGEFADAFPTDRQLREEYGVSRQTARDAVRRLQDEGVVARQRGRGTFVRVPEIEQPVGVLYSLFRSVEDQGFEQRSKVLGLDRVVDRAAAGHLGLRPTTALVHLRRLRQADDVPIAVDDVWLPARLAAPLLEVDFEHTALYAELDARCGVRPTSGWERVHPALPSTDDAELLGIPAGQPVFRVERFTEAAGQPLEWRCTVIRGDTYAFVSTWRGQAGDVRLGPTA